MDREGQERKQSEKKIIQMKKNVSSPLIGPQAKGAIALFFFLILSEQKQKDEL